MALGATHEYKIILLGEVGVGKTTFFFRIRDERFVDTENLIRFPERLAHTLEIGGTEVKVMLHDTFGAERFRTFTSTYYRGSDAALLMYSVEDQASLDYLYEETKNAEYLIDSSDFVWAVIGNKSDLPSAVEEYRVKSLCELLDTKLLFFTSAKTGENVKSAFEQVIHAVHEKRAKCVQAEKMLNEDTHLLTQLPIQKKTCCS